MRLMWLEVNWKRFVSPIFSCSFLLFCGGCGYHFVSSGERISVSLPFVGGDRDGTLTTELARALCNSGRFTVSQEGQYRLEVTIMEDRFEPLGYRSNRQLVDGEMQMHLTQNEERRSLCINVTVCDSQTGSLLFGPLSLWSDVGYDYLNGDALSDLKFIDSKGNSKVVLPFSLGQLETRDSAQEAALLPLYRKVAEKIVNLLDCRM